MSTVDLAQFVWSGIIMGCSYALVAVGLSIVFGTSGILNILHGEYLMIATMIAITLVGTGLPLALAIGIALLAILVLAAVIVRLTVQPLIQAPHWTIVIVTAGLQFFFMTLAMLIWGKEPLVLPAYSGASPLNLAGLRIVPQSLWVLGVTLVALVGLWLFLQRTITGKAMWACAINPLAASLAGISVRRMVFSSYLLAAFLAALGGVVTSPLTYVSYETGVWYLLKGFAAAVIGGFGNPAGAIGGGLVVGLLEALTAGYISSAYKDAITMFLILFVLLVRPTGLFAARNG